MPRAPTDRLCPVPIIPDQSQGRWTAAPDFELAVGDEQPANVAHKAAENIMWKKGDCIGRDLYDIPTEIHKQRCFEYQSTTNNYILEILI